MSITGKHIAFVGAGNMAEALIKGLLQSKIVKAKQITASDVNKKRLRWLKEEYCIRTSSSNTDAIEKSDIILLAVKPQVLPELLVDISEKLAGKLVISIAAGITISKIENALPKNTPVIRVMPNTPALVQRGAAAISCGKSAKKNHAVMAMDIFRSVGFAIQVDEKFMDIITAISGSGPAYVFYLMEAMIKQAVKGGIEPAEALHLVAETVRGAGELVDRTSRSPADLRKCVTSPGGTTEAALKVMKEHDFLGIVSDAISAAVKRSHDLSK